MHICTYSVNFNRIREQAPRHPPAHGGPSPILYQTRQATSVADPNATAVTVLKPVRRGSYARVHAPPSRTSITELDDRRPSFGAWRTFSQPLLIGNQAQGIGADE